ncbi:MAG: hemolysin [Gemmatimonadetes bacterium]|nr:hemolysin [Gemmatimonadota bacterium]
MRRILIPLLLVAVAACKEEVAPLVYQAVPVETRAIAVSVRAAGNVQPDTVVEVKSKASGEILQMAVETGQDVSRGQLLVQVDQRTPRNTLAQTEAELEVAKARFANAEAQNRRSTELFKSASITEQEHETAVLAVANARAEVVRAQVAYENAKIRMDDTDVRAPIAGTIISKNVERGQVISSPTSDVGGGTVLLKMADLNLVQVRTLVDETDIGKVRAGLRASVTVDAYPNQPFTGEVLKIEPQAETAQNVTMFPVLIRIENRNGLLKPGMNADVEIQVGRRDSALAVPNAALRTQRDVNSAAQVLGIDSTRFAEMMRLADAVRDSARQAAAPARDSAKPAGAPAPAPAPGGATMTTPDGRTIALPPGVTEPQVREIFRKRFSGGTLTAQEQAVMQQLMRSMGGGRAGGGARRPGGSDYQFGGDYIVFVNRGGEIVPVHIRTGLTDLDYSEVISGLKATDSVVILPSASLVQAQEQFRQRMGSFANQGVPGMRQTTNTPTPAGAAATPARPTGGTGGPR